MKEKIFKTGNDWTGLVLRLTLGFVLIPHGAQKLLGWFGGNGFSGTMNFFTEMAGLPWLIGFFVIVIEFFGSLSIIAGFASRVWSFFNIILFAGIIFKIHSAYGFFMNWSGTQPGEGFEYHLLIIGLSLALIINGSGLFSLDGLISKRKTTKVLISKTA